jgi:hypothetical protein
MNEIGVSKNFQLILLMNLLIPLLVACSSTSQSASPVIVPVAGFGPARPGTAEGDRWWITSNIATLSINGKVNSSGIFSTTVVKTPCGPADIQIGNLRLKVLDRSSVVIPLKIGASGTAPVRVEMFSGYCQPRGEPRPLYGLLTDLNWNEN